MGKVLLATVLGAVVLFAWGMAAWMLLPLHNGSIKSIPDEVGVAAFLQQQGLQTGVYIFPFMPDMRNAAVPKEDAANAQKQWEQRHEQGPIFSIFFSTEGLKPWSPKPMAWAWAINLSTVFIAALLLRVASRGGLTYMQRVGFVMLMGVFAAIIGHGSLCVWMLFPLDWTLAMMVDMGVGWTLVGFVVGAIIKPPAPAAIPAA